MEKIYSANATILMRVGTLGEIKDCYEKGKISFGCPLNWLNYALMKNNFTVGDIHECVFAHLKQNDPLIEQASALRGEKLLKLESADGTCYLSLIPTLLAPALCFWAIDMQKKCTETNRTKHLFDLEKFSRELSQKEDCGYLIIIQPQLFFDDLCKQIPRAIQENLQILTCNDYDLPFNPKQPIKQGYVDYDRHRNNELFFDPQDYGDEIFWKMPEYREQSELRFVIPNISFDPNCEIARAKKFKIKDVQAERYDQNMFRLEVKLQNIKKYAYCFSYHQAKSLLFEGVFDEDTYGFLKVYRESAEQLSRRMLDEASRIN